MNERELCERLRAAEWPAPSADLAARVAAIRVRSERISWSDRIWYSRAWRIGIAAAILGTVALDVWDGRAASRVAPTVVAAEVETTQELIRSAGVPDDAAALIARRQMRPSRVTSDRNAWLSGEDQ